MNILDTLADFIVRLVNGREAVEERKARRVALAARTRLAAQALDDARKRSRLDRGEF